MIEALLFVVGLVLLWKGGGVLNEFFFTVEEQANGYSEAKLTELALEREDRLKLLTDEMSERDLAKFTTHDEYMNKIGFRK
jgi:hypothetical protein